MTIQEAVTAARNNTPVIYDSPTLGPMLYARIVTIVKEFALRESVARGTPAERYMLELADMNRNASRLVCPPERVRTATAAELADAKMYHNK